MKITFFQLGLHLAKALSPIYLLSGEELLLKQEAAHLIRKAAKSAGFDQRTHFVLAKESEDDLYTLLHTQSLLSEKQLLELDFRHHTPTQTASKILQEYSDKLNSNRLMLIDIGKLDDKISKSAWYKALEKIGMVVTIWPMTREKLPQWIIQRAKKYKLAIDQENANLLADYVEGNLSAAAQALEKIYLYPRLSQTIDAHLIKTILSDESRFSVFDFVETLIASHTARALHILESLKQEGTEPTLILWAITRELRLLIALAQALKQGETLDLLFKKHRIFFQHQTAVRSFLNHFTLNDCLKLLTQAGEIDLTIKGAKAGNIWHALQFFVCSLRF